MNDDVKEANVCLKEHFCSGLDGVLCVINTFANHTCLRDELHTLWLLLRDVTDVLYSYYNFVAFATNFQPL